MSLKEVLINLSQEAKDLYLDDSVPVVEGPPESALSFHRDFVSRNRPALFRGAVAHWEAVRRWGSDEYLRERAGGAVTTVTATPDGYADAIHRDEDGREVFVTPHEDRLPFSSFLDRLSSPREGEVLYVQTQNSNLTSDSEMSSLRGDVEEPEWAREALGEGAGGRPPDAVNFWMGDGRAVTSTHKDPYENIYCVVRGHKDVTLFPPSDLPWLRYRRFPCGEFVREGEGFRIRRRGDLGEIPWVSVDPLRPEKDSDFSLYASPLKVRVEAGDALYLPSLWFHHLRQSHGCIAVNFWYDMEFDARFAYLNLLSQLDEKVRKEEEVEKVNDKEL